MLNAFVSGFCGSVGAIVAVVIAVLIWILLKMLFGEKPKKSQADINQQSLDALIQRNRLTLETNMRLARLGDSLSGIDGTLMDWRGIRKVKNEVVECESCKPGKTCDDCKYPGC